jgi:putative hemolysin
MDTSLFWNLLIIVLLALVNGFFSMAEMSLVSSRTSTIKARVQEGKRSYERVLHIKEKPGRFLSTIQIAITLIGIVSGAVGGANLTAPLVEGLQQLPFLAPYAEALGASLMVLGVTYISIVLGELVPKHIALSHPEFIALLVTPVLNGITLIFTPLVNLLSKSTQFIVTLLRIPEKTVPPITEEELRIALLEGEQAGVVQSKERHMVEGVFYLGDRPVSTFMTHRSEIEGIDMALSIPDLAGLLKSGKELPHFIPLYKESLDNIIGILYREDLYRALALGNTPDLSQLMKKAMFIPETMPALRAFEVFKQEGTEILCIIDEYGGFSGILQFQQLIEEIVGELSRSDADHEEIIKRENGSYLVGGGVNIDEIAEVLGKRNELPDHREYSTLAGFILDISGKIPRTGEVFTWQDLQFEIVDMDGNRIDKVIISRRGEPLKDGPSPSQ